MNKPYHETDHGVLYQGDCLDILPTLADKSVDLVLTDPPYGIGASNKSFRSGKGWADYGDSTWDNEVPAKECFDIMLKGSENQIIWGGNYFAKYLPVSMGWLVWNKMQRNFSLADGELAWTSFNNALRIFDYSRGAALQDGKVHPTQKPVALFGWCLQNYSKEQDLILDPFAGSGTTAIACIRYNRRYILIEKEEKYCDIAAKRIESELDQTTINLEVSE
jgi:DNA modification methylase